MTDNGSIFERKRIRDSVKACVQCDLSSRCKSPVPFSGPSTPKLVIVGEAPGEQEDAAGEPFVGPSGSELRKWVVDSGWSIDDVAFVNSVCCWANRTPTAREIAACQTNLVSQLAHLNPRRLIVVGGVAVQALRNAQVRIGEIRGLWWRPDRVALPNEAWALATWHPSAVLRNRKLEFEAFDDFSYASTVIQRGYAPHRGQFCIKCGSPEVDWFVDIPYCKRHMPSKAKG